MLIFVSERNNEVGDRADEAPVAVFRPVACIGLSYNEYAMNEVFNKIEYVVCCVGAFAERFHLTNAQAYAYLRRFSGIDFLIDCYAAEHTLSIDDAVEDLTNICLKNGGKLI